MPAGLERMKVWALLDAASGRSLGDPRVVCGGYIRSHESSFEFLCAGEVSMTVSKVLWRGLVTADQRGSNTRFSSVGVRCDSGVRGSECVRAVWNLC